MGLSRQGCTFAPRLSGRNGISIVDAVVGLVIIGFALLMIYKLLKPANQEGQAVKIRSAMQYLESAIQASTEELTASLDSDALESLQSGTIPADFDLDLFGENLDSTGVNRFNTDGEICVGGILSNDCPIEVSLQISSPVANQYELGYTIRNQSSTSSRIQEVTGLVPIPRGAIASANAQQDCIDGFVMGIGGNPARVQCISFDQSVQCGPGEIAKGLIFVPPAANGADARIRVECQPIRRIGCASSVQTLLSVNPYYFDPTTTLPTGANADKLGECGVPIMGSDPSNAAVNLDDNFQAPDIYAAMPPSYPNPTQGCPEQISGQTVYQSQDSSGNKICTLEPSFRRQPAQVAP